MMRISDRMVIDMTIASLSEGTQKKYLDANSELCRYYDNRPPGQITEDELKAFFLHLKNDKGLAKSTLNQKYCGIRFLFPNTLNKEFPVFSFIKAGREKRLPVVLSRNEVCRGIAGVISPVHRMVLKVVYCDGLRISEALSLRAGSIDRDRKVLTVRLGKGGKDRQVPLLSNLLKELETYWRKDRQRADNDLLFPSPYNGGQSAIHASSVRTAFQKSLQTAGVTKSASLHTLRHSFATHLLESGVHLKIIQRLLGHKDMSSTMIYLHLTDQAFDDARRIMDEMASAL